MKDSQEIASDLRNSKNLDRYSSNLIKRGLILATKVNINTKQSDHNRKTEAFGKLFFEGISQYLLGNRLLSIDYFSQLLEMNPDCIEALHMRGFAYEIIGEKEKSYHDLSLSLTLDHKDNDSIHVLYGKGIAYLHAGDQKTGLHCLALTMQSEPSGDILQNSLDFYFRGSAKYILGDKIGAMKDFNQALEVNSNCLEALSMKGLINYDLGNNIEAISILSQVLDFNPNYDKSDHIYYIRGLSNSNIEKVSSAINDFTKSLLLNQNNPDTYFYRGCLHLRDYKAQEALSDFNTTLQIKPDFIQAYIYRAVLYSLLGESQKSICDLEQAISLDINTSISVIKQLESTIEAQTPLNVQDQTSKIITLNLLRSFLEKTISK